MAAKYNPVMLIMLGVAAFLQHATGVTYRVGENSGWIVPPGGAADYSNWAARYTFMVGDVLEFNFRSGVHTVAQVTRDDFDACNIEDPQSVKTQGPANYTLDRPGDFYFICTLSDHCSQGQQLAVTVTSSGVESPASAPSPGGSPGTPSGGAAPPPPRTQGSSATRMIDVSPLISVFAVFVTLLGQMMTDIVLPIFPFLL